MITLALVSILVARPNFDAAAKYSADHSGFSFLVMRNGTIIEESYPNRGSATRGTELASGTKSFSGITAACAVEDGLITWDERVSNTITEWKSDARKSKITVRQLLSLSSGLPGGSFGRVPDYQDAIKVAANAEVGEKFQYGPVPYQCFGEFMRRKLRPLKEGVLDYMTRRIFDPLGMAITRWRKDSDGNPHLPSGAFLTAREWAKFGEMVRQGGEGVTSEALVNECLKSQGANPGYGLTWWLPSQGKVGANARTRRTGVPRDMKDEVVMAAGMGGQRLYVIRSQGLVIVRQAPVMSPAGPRGFKDEEFLALLPR